tara:strand:- start:300 stop:1685 length:1386 start_codon:yes stop_codon:yes gene_type:complete
LDVADAASYPGTGTTWTDLVAGQTFSLVNSPLYNSEIGYFNFQNSYASGTVTPTLAPTRGAIEIWTRWRASSALTAAVFLKGGSNWYSFGNVANPPTDESIEFNTGISATMDYQAGHTFYRDSEWHQITAVIDGVANQIYVDGAPLPDPPGTTFRSGNALSTGLLALGATLIGEYGGGYTYDGDIAILRVYDTGTDSFSAADVAQNYAAQSARFATFQPDNIASLTLWIDPSDANTVTTAAGGEVIEIFDKARAADRASFKAPFGSPNGPTIVTDGGINWLGFTPTDSLVGKKVAGANSWLRSDVFSGNTYETHIVLKPTAVPSQNATNPWQNNGVGPSDSTGFFGMYVKDVGGAPFVQPYNYSTRSTYGGFALPVDDKAIAGHSRDAAAVTNYKDGAATGAALTALTSLSGSSGTLELGVGSSAQYFEGQIGEVLMFNEELSTSDRDDLIAYLKAKWGIS